MKTLHRIKRLEARQPLRKYKLTREMNPEEQRDLFKFFQSLCDTDDAATQAHLDAYERKYERR